MCPRKAGFPTQGLAEKAAKKARLRTNDIIQPYYCTDCVTWHIGHRPLRALRGER